MPTAATPMPSSTTVRRRSGDTVIAQPASSSASTSRSGASSLIVSPSRARLALRLPTSRVRSGTFPLSSTCLASPGRSFWTAAARTVPTSPTVSVTVFLSRLKTARWTSRTAARKRPVKARPPTISPAIDSMIGRAASRSASLRRMTSSVILSAISDLTLSSRSAAVARLANWSELMTAIRT
jgi:hypothetical protein